MRDFNKIQMFVCDSHMTTLTKKGNKLVWVDSHGHLVAIMLSVTDETTCFMSSF